MDAVTIHDAKTNLSKLILRAESGEEVVISRGNRSQPTTDWRSTAYKLSKQADGIRTVSTVFQRNCPPKFIPKD